MKSAPCVFCKIIAGEIPSPRIFEDEACIVIRDIHPQAPTHLLVIPKKHVRDLDQAFEGGIVRSGSELLGQIHFAAHEAAKACGITQYRAIINSGKSVGQTVFHLHLHVLGGEEMGERL
jgi:histidine triad (HIT) family protein